MNARKDHLYIFERFSVDAENRVLLRDGEPVPLAPKAFDTLLALVKNSGRLLEKKELLKMVWPDSFVEEINLTVHISALRKALGEHPTEQRYIATVPKRGYRFVAEVRGPGSASGGPARVQSSGLAVESQEARLERPLDVVTASAQPSPVRLKSKALALIMLASAILLSSALFYFLPESRGGRQQGDQLLSIAVLPFRLLSADLDEYLGVGIADALITKLSNINRIIVRPTSAVLKYDGSNQDTLAAGSELGVDSLLTGVVQKSGSNIRVTVQLVRVRDGASLWGEEFEEDFTSMLRVQNLISKRVAEALMLKLSGEEKKRIAKQYTESAEAYQSYLKGRYYLNKSTADEIRKGIAQFEKAIAIDPACAVAYAGLADCYTRIGFEGALPPWEATGKAKAAMVKALELDDTLAEAHTSLALIKMHYDRDWQGALKEFDRAIELSPNDAMTRQWYAWCLLILDRTDESRAEMKRAVELDPVSLMVNTHLGMHFFYTRDYDRAIEQYRKTLDMDPNYISALQLLGQSYLVKGMYDEGIAAFQKASNLSGVRTDFFAYGYAISGRRAEAVKKLNELKEMSARRYVSPYRIARIHVGLGEKDLAFEWLAKAVEERDQRLFWLKLDPTFDSLRSDKRFVELLARISLTP